MGHAGAAHAAARAWPGTRPTTRAGGTRPAGGPRRASRPRRRRSSSSSSSSSSSDPSAPGDRRDRARRPRHRATPAPTSPRLRRRRRSPSSRSRPGRRRPRPGRRRSRSTARHRSGTRPRSPGTAWWSSSTHPCTPWHRTPPRRLDAVDRRTCVRAARSAIRFRPSRVLTVRVGLGRHCVDRRSRLERNDRRIVDADIRATAVSGPDVGPLIGVVAVGALLAAACNVKPNDYDGDKKADIVYIAGRHRPAGAWMQDGVATPLWAGHAQRRHRRRRLRQRRQVGAGRARRARLVLVEARRTRSTTTPSACRPRTRTGRPPSRAARRRSCRFRPTTTATATPTPPTTPSSTAPGGSAAATASPSTAPRRTTTVGSTGTSRCRPTTTATSRPTSPCSTPPTTRFHILLSKTGTERVVTVPERCRGHAGSGRLRRRQHHRPGGVRRRRASTWWLTPGTPPRPHVRRRRRPRSDGRHLSGRRRLRRRQEGRPGVLRTRAPARRPRLASAGSTPTLATLPSNAGTMPALPVRPAGQPRSAHRLRKCLAGTTVTAYPGPVTTDVEPVWPICPPAADGLRLRRRPEGRRRLGDRQPDRWSTARRGRRRSPRPTPTLVPGLRAARRRSPTGCRRARRRSSPVDRGSPRRRSIPYAPPAWSSPDLPDLDRHRRTEARHGRPATTSTPSPGNPPLDHLSEPAYYVEATGQWYLDGTPDAVTWGTTPSAIGRPRLGRAGARAATTSAVAGARVAVYRPSDSTFRSYGDGSVIAVGRPGDLPAQADYDGDAVTDAATYRPVDRRVVHRRASRPARWPRPSTSPAELGAGPGRLRRRRQGRPRAVQHRRPPLGHRRTRRRRHARR